MKESILDGEGFDAEAYVKELLERESLSGLLKVEGELMDGTSFVLGWAGLRIRAYVV